MAEWYFHYRESVIETCGFSDILFATKLAKRISLVARQIKLRSNITRRKANKTENDKFLSKLVVFFGEDEWARTTDPLHVKQVLWPTELHPHKLFIVLLALVIIAHHAIVVNQLIKII